MSFVVLGIRYEHLELANHLPGTYLKKRERESRREISGGGREEDGKRGEVMENR